MVLLKYLPEIAGVLIFIMMATQMPAIGPMLILIEFGLVGLLFLFRTTTFLDALLRWWPVLLAPILAAVSALWSEAPMASARYGTQFLFTAFVGVLLARLMTPKRYICVFLAAMFIFCILSILSGRQGYSAQGAVLVGLTGSKNQLGYAAQLLMLSALAVLMMRQMAMPLRWLALLSLPIAVYLLAETDSATAVLMAAGGAAALIILWFSQRFPPGGRLAALIGAVLILAPLTALTAEMIEWVNHFVFDTLNKDPTLTGRTLLWARADDLIVRKPLFGYGYQAIWMGDSTETIALRRLTNINDGRAFHFHHQFRQIAVDTGLVGVVAFSCVLIAVGFSALRQLLLRPSVATSFFLVLFLLMTVRAFTDVIIMPFSVHTLLFFASCVYAFWRPEHAAAQAPAFAWRGGGQAAAAAARYARR